MIQEGMALKRKKTGKGKLLSKRLRQSRAIETDLKRRLLVEHCLRMESLGPVPGMALLRIHGTIYDPEVKEYHRVPGLHIKTRIESLGELEEVFKGIEAALQARGQGRWLATANRFQCQCGRLL